MKKRNGGAARRAYVTMLPMINSALLDHARDGALLGKEA
jgi:hypothetical protein